MAALDLEQTAYWINILHGNSVGLINIVSTNDWAGRSFVWGGQEAEALDYVSDLDAAGAEGIYLRVTTLKSSLEPGRRGSDVDSLALPGLWADLDLAGPGHKTVKPLPQTLEDATRIIAEAGLPEPSLWIHSGGGLYPWWLFKQPQLLVDPESLAAAASLSTLWQQCLGAAADRLGWHYGTGVGDMPRVLRLPGTVNRKVPGDPKPCRVLAEEGRLYEFDELVAIVTEVAPVPEPIPAPRSVGSSSFGGLRPGDDFEARVSWDDALLLGGQGARINSVKGRTVYWTKPGGSPRKYHATTGHDTAYDRLYVFTDEWEPFEQGQVYGKFAAYTMIHHRGDFRGATKALVDLGYGEPLASKPKVAPLTEFLYEPSEPVRRPLLPSPRGVEDYSNSGAVARLVQAHGQFMRYVTEEKIWRVWDGVAWRRDEAGTAVTRAFEAMTEDMRDECRRMEADPDQAEMAKAYKKHIQKLRDSSRVTILSLVASWVTVSAEVFDADPRYLNLRNGVYDMVADAFLPHDPKYLLTKVAGISYDPAATAVDAEAFLESVLPVEPMREFTLQALGDALTGEADRKAFFVLQGLSNSGKTQILEMSQTIFGDYAVPVSPGAFAQRHNPGAPTPELHEMRGARFIFTSETSHELQLDEEMVKRFTGKDTMTTRTLYQKPQRWVPQGTVWVATNNLPRFSADEEAMWRRVKTIRFTNVFTDDGSSGHMAIANIGRTLATKEGSGIFNILLAALRRLRAAGRLMEPQELVASISEHRKETDTLARHVGDLQDNGELVEDSDYDTNLAQVYQGYRKVCESDGVQPLGPQRFGMALRQHLKYETKRANSITWMIGWRFTGMTWISHGPATRRRQ